MRTVRIFSMRTKCVLIFAIFVLNRSTFAANKKTK